MSFCNRIRVLILAGSCLVLALLLAGAYLQTDHEKAVMDEVVLECTLDGQKMFFGLWEDAEESVYRIELEGPFGCSYMNKGFRYLHLKIFLL